MIDLALLLNQIENIAETPPPIEYAVAALNDFLLSAGFAPMKKAKWDDLFAATAPSEDERKLMLEKKIIPPEKESQLAILACWGLETDLYAQTRAGLAEMPMRGDTKSVFTELFTRIRGVPDTIMARVRFRQEEALRAWASAFSVGITGETAAESKARLLRLDYFGVMAEALKAEAQAEKKRRAAALRRMEAEKKAAAEAAARGNYE